MEYKQKMLTIVICCYNSTKTIKNTLDSIDCEHNKNVDVFVIDDGSSDNLQECIKDYLEKYPNEIHYFRKENGNWGSCLNFAIKHANSRFLSVLDSDDAYNSRSLTTVLEILKNAKPQTDLVFCNYEFHFLNTKKTTIKHIIFSKTNKWIKYLPFNKLKLYHLFTIHSAIFSLEVLKKIKPLPEKLYYTDNILIYQTLCNVSNIGFINKNVYLYKYYIRRGNQSISIERSLQNYHQFEIIYQELLSLPIDSKDKKRMKVAKKCISTFIYWFLRILCEDFLRVPKIKYGLIKGYIRDYEKYQKNNFGKVCLNTGLINIAKVVPKVALDLTRVVVVLVNNNFVKATRYSRENKKEARLLSKAKKKAKLAIKKEKIKIKLRKIKNSFKMKPKH